MAGDGDVREAFLAAFDENGGMDTLAAWGRNNPAQFYALFAKLVAEPGAAEAAHGYVSAAPLSEAEWLERARTLI